MEVLVISPHVDTATHFSSIVARMVLSEARRRNIDTTAIEASECNREYLETFMAKRKGVYDAVIFYGHGNEDAWLGADDLPLVDLDNIAILKGSIILGICCLSAKMLLKQAVTSNIVGGIGFTDLLYLPGSEKKGLISDTRNYTADFMRTFFLIPLCLIKGFTILRTVNEFKELCTEYYNLYQESSEDYADSMKMWMMHNAKTIEFVGHPSMSLEAELVV